MSSGMHAGDFPDASRRSFSREGIMGLGLSCDHAFCVFELRDHGLYGLVVLSLPRQLSFWRINCKQGEKRLSSNTLQFRVVRILLEGREDGVGVVDLHQYGLLQRVVQGIVGNRHFLEGDTVRTPGGIKIHKERFLFRFRPLLGHGKIA